MNAQLDFQDNGPTRIEIILAGFSTERARERGFHIHTTGAIGNGCGGAGGHYNPSGVDHSAPDAQSVSIITILLQNFKIPTNVFR